MDRKTLWYAFVALLGGCALALTAATFPTATRSGGETGVGSGENGDGSFTLPEPADAPGRTFEGFPYLSELLAVFALITAGALLWYLVSNWQEALKRFLEGAVLAAGLFVLFHLLTILISELPRDEAEFGIADDPVFDSGGDGGGDGLLSTEPTSVIVVLLVVLGIVLAGVLLVLRDDSPETESQPDPRDESEMRAAIGRVAGKTADRLESDADLENEIYRAWVEMAQLVRPSSPETKTPTEFAEAAVETGLEPADVSELTRLFEDARYGADDPSAREEQRAVTLLRRIEETYTEEES